MGASSLCSAVCGARLWYDAPKHGHLTKRIPFEVAGSCAATKVRQPLAILLQVSVNGFMAPRRDRLPHVDQLATLDAKALKELWHRVFSTAPPVVARKEFYIRILAFEVQSRSAPRLPRIRIDVLRGRTTRQKRGVSTANDERLRPGTRLVREWRGVTHEVMVMDGGYAYRGRSFSSLSEIARKITGSRWSGPRFFGLRAPSRRNEPEKTG
jgi:hypothetical protein